MPAISGSVIHCVGEQVFFALDLKEIFTRQPRTHTHTHILSWWNTSRCYLRVGNKQTSSSAAVRVIGVVIVLL